MAKDARMLHKKISLSGQVNKLSLQAKLLFTWLISHADDEGRLSGDPEYIKATVVPRVKWSMKAVKTYIEEMINQKLIYYWEQNGEWFIEFIKWKNHQTIRGDRFKPSSLPSFPYKEDNQLVTIPQPIDDQTVSEININEFNPSEINISEDNQNPKESEGVPFKGNEVGINPKTFEPKTESESAALEAWKTLEPFNPFAFVSTYLWAVKKGLPADMFYQFVSEIKDDSNIKSKGAVFRVKAEAYLKSLESMIDP